MEIPAAADLPAPTSAPVTAPTSAAVPPPAGIPAFPASPPAPPVPPAVVPPRKNPEPEAVVTIPAPAGHATIVGSEDASMLLDNFTVFVARIDGIRISAGRDGWETPLRVRSGAHALEVEFNRGVFVARAALNLEARADAEYEVKFKTDAAIFGGNSYCNFWIVDRRTGRTVSSVEKVRVEKITVAENAPAHR